VSEAQFFFPKRKREFSFEHGAKRRRRKSVRPWPGGRGFKWRAPSAVADGSSPFKPQTVLLRRSRAVGIDETRCRRAEHGSRASIKKGRSKRGQARGVSRFFGLWPLLGGDDASKASCGVIRSGSSEPWFDRKNDKGEIHGNPRCRARPRRKSFLPIDRFVE
jgi:hypothetical protein